MNLLQNRSFILASGSSARRNLLERAGLEFTVQPADVDEAPLKAMLEQQGIDADTAAHALTALKGEEASMRFHGEHVLAGDQLVSCDGIWSGKPKSIEDARTRLWSMRNKTLLMHTGCGFWLNGIEQWSTVKTVMVYFRDFSEMCLEAYLAAMGEEVLHIAGGCPVEGLGKHLLDRIEGEQSAILGLPMLEVLGYLRKVGILAD